MSTTTNEQKDARIRRLEGDVAALESQVRSLSGAEPPDVMRNCPAVADGDGVTDEERHMLRKLWGVWANRRANNVRRILYRSGKNIAKHLGLAIKNGSELAAMIRPVCGWPAKAVEELADLSRLDYCTFPDDGADDDLLAAWEGNGVDALYAMAADSQLTEGIVHWVVTRGDPSTDEPAVMVNCYSALNSASVWDSRHKRIAYGMVINDADANGMPTQVTLHAPNEVLVLALAPNGRWVSRRAAHKMGRCLMEPMPYRPTLDKPLGKSRITGAVMSITDNAVREVMRSEVAAEVYTAPKRAILGLKPSQLPKDPKTYWNAIDALPLTDAGNNPNYVQMNPPGMNDHILYMRQLAAQFAGETRLPLSSLGVISDNPSSAEAIYAAKEGLIIEAENMNRTNSRSIENVARLIMATAKNVAYDELPEELRRVRAHWRRPDRQSVATMVDAMVKLSSAISGFGQTKEALRMAGFDEGEVERIQSELGRGRGLDFLQQMVESTEVRPWQNTGLRVGTDA